MNGECQKRALRLGFLVNPYAGIGGAAALKGSDGVNIRDQALAFADGELRVSPRIKRFLQALNQQAYKIDWHVGQGLMGEQFLKELGIQPVSILGMHDVITQASDTHHLVTLLEAKSVDLIVFVGGDGTARDIISALQFDTPCLGMPSGVKMQSGVFALSPESAAHIVLEIIESELVSFKNQDVRDIDEQALREGRVRSQYFGSMKVPSSPLYLQHLKQGGVEDEELVLHDIAAHIDELMHEERLMIVGPGRTLAFWMQHQSLPNTLVGFDAVQSGRVIQSDLTAKDLLQLQNQYPDLLLLLSPTGQQGVIIGRGNQQLSAEFLSRLPKEQWRIVATKNKLASLLGKPLIVDSNDVETDKRLCGLYPIICAYHQEVLYPINITYKNE